MEWCAVKLKEAGEIDDLREVDFNNPDQRVKGFNLSTRSSNAKKATVLDLFIQSIVEMENLYSTSATYKLDFPERSALCAIINRCKDNPHEPASYAFVLFELMRLKDLIL